MAIDNKGRKVINEPTTEQVELSKRLEELRRKKLEAIARLKQKYKESMTYKRPVVKGSKQLGRKPPFIKSGKIFTEPIADKYVRKYEPILSEEEIEFLKESNAIEGEYSAEALVDAKAAWAYAKYYRKKIRKDYVRKIHKHLMRRLNPTIAGNIRQHDVYVGSPSSGFKKCLHPQKIKYALEEFFQTSPGIRPLNRQDTYCTIPAIDERLIKESHIKFEAIHPFADGNGRVGRILMNVQRLNLKLPLLIIHQGLEQQAYYKWFDELNKGRKYKKPKPIHHGKRKPKDLNTPGSLDNQQKEEHND